MRGPDGRGPDNRMKNAQAVTVPTAIRAGEPWWPEEDAMVMDPTITARDTALALCRTYRSVVQRGKKLRAAATSTEKGTPR